MQKFSAKENFLISNTLNCIPLLLEGEAVLIDLRNDTSVAGRIDNTDGNMNIHLKEVVFIDRHGGQHPFNEFMIRERMIRQIHIPEHINMLQRIQDWCDAGCSKRYPHGMLQKTSKKLTAKQKRTQERHKEILQQIAIQKMQKSDDKVDKG